MKIGYCRVSTEDQNPDWQLTALKRAGCKRIFTDKASGAHVKRLQLTQCLASLQAGDVLIVWKLDRLGRSLRDLIALLDDLKARDVAFRSLTEAIDTATPTGRTMWQMVGILAELERSLIQERTKPVVASLVERLKPRCLAMCGVCAGNPGDVALGDVIIAEMVYPYDEGKQKQDVFEGDHRQTPMLDTWVRAA